MDYKRKELLVPIELLRYAFRNKCISPIRLFIYLKMVSDGQVLNKSRFIMDFCKDLGIKEKRTIKKHFQFLEDSNLINYDCNKNLFIRGWTRAFQVFTMRSRTGVWTNFEDLMNFRVFVFSAVIGWMINKLKMRAWKRGRLNGRSKQSFSSYLNYFGHSNKIIANELCISKGLVSRYKKVAMKCGYLTINHKYKGLNSSAEYYWPYVKIFPNEYGKVRIKKGELVKQLTDEISPNLKFKKKKIQINNWQIQIKK